MSITEKFRRAERRRKSQRVAQRRRTVLTCYAHEGSTLAPCTCKLTSAYFTKRSLGCGCRKRTKGNPRFSSGLCKMECRDRIYLQRRQALKLNNFVCTQHMDPQNDAVALLT